ncbi:unnamed protein product [Parnassius apollo]|uniref:(apollo) hypothetical protein n=1 Tax=Parnassius apollo TaxID=110799 RepID=A0A8S3Y4U6_PARAO|nr:unnamed protein product [Parnassius apollo]
MCTGDALAGPGIQAAYTNQAPDIQDVYPDYHHLRCTGLVRTSERPSEAATAGPAEPDIKDDRRSRSLRPE